jgi:hypothetical protein
LELLQLLVCLEEGILRNVFSVFTVLRYMLRYSKDLAFILPYQLLKGCCVSTFGALNQRYVWVDLFRTWGLDGWHEQKGALILERSWP